MTFKTTAKNIRENGRFTCKVGYCELPHLLRDLSPIAYNYGVYGWNFDVYDIDGYTLTTGYRNMVGNRLPYELTEALEKKAEQITLDRSLTYEEQKAARSGLLEELKKAMRDTYK